MKRIVLLLALAGCGGAETAVSDPTPPEAPVAAVDRAITPDAAPADARPDANPCAVAQEPGTSWVDAATEANAPCWSLPKLYPDAAPAPASDAGAWVSTDAFPTCDSPTYVPGSGPCVGPHPDAGPIVPDAAPEAALPQEPEASAPEAACITLPDGCRRPTDVNHFCDSSAFGLQAGLAEIICQPTASVGLSGAGCAGVGTSLQDEQYFCCPPTQAGSPSGNALCD